MDLLIRPVRLSDAEAIARILNTIIAAGCYTVLEGPLTAEAERDFIARFPPRGVFLVAERRPDGAIVGLQDVEPFAPYSHAFDHVGTMGTFVDLACRRQGIGARLTGETLAVARRQGFEKILTCVRADNPGGLAFYRQIGFRVVGTAERQALLGGQYIDEILIEKLL